jgi:hypothetical protein
MNFAQDHTDYSKYTDTSVPELPAPSGHVYEHLKHNGKGAFGSCLGVGGI